MGLKTKFFKLTGLVLLSFFQGPAAFCAEAQQGIFAEEIGTAKKVADLLVEFSVKYSFQALGGIVVVILGFFLARVIAGLAEKAMLKKNVDVTVTKFMVSIIKMTVIVFAALIALGKFGITIAPFIAGLSVIGFGASFAVQGPLSNYAAGATLIFTKPFKVGDIVEVSDAMGEVTDVTLARTQMKTLDGTIIFVPNKSVIGETIHNYGEYKKLDVNVGVSYGADVEKAIRVIKDVVAGESRISPAPEPKIGISAFADSSVNIYARLWCKPEDYLDSMFDVNNKIFARFKEEKIEIPFPQRDVHLFDHGKKEA